MGTDKWLGEYSRDIKWKTLKINGRCEHNSQDWTTTNSTLDVHQKVPTVLMIRTQVGEIIAFKITVGFTAQASQHCAHQHTR